jgi:hypothetical protein
MHVTHTNASMHVTHTNASMHVHTHTHTHPQVRQNASLGRFYVQGLSKNPVASYDEIAKKMDQGTDCLTDMHTYITEFNYV